MDKFIRPDLASFGGYSAHTSPDTLADEIDVSLDAVIKLDANENPYGPSPRVSRALADVAYNVYPDDAQTVLRGMLADYCGVGAEHIVAGHGSNQLIDLVVRLLVGPGDEVINSVPTFALYRFSTVLCGGVVVEVPRDAGFGVDMCAVKAAVTPNTRLIPLANPNSPTGTITPEEDIIRLLDTGMPVLVDEAYYEFCGCTVAPLMERYDNLMILRTFSKWAGLAGLRIGYGIFPVKIADYLMRTKIPYNVNVAALKAVEASLADLDFLMGNVKAITRERDRLYDGLLRMPRLKPFPSLANFVLCEVKGGGAEELAAKLKRRGILVRCFGPSLKGFIRISVGRQEHTDAVLKALGEIEEEQGGTSS